MNERLGVGELFVLLLIGLSFIEFFGVLPSDIDFMKKVVSWTILGSLLFHVSLTKVFFGDRHRSVDVLLIIAFFLILLKDLVVVAAALFPKGGLFSDIYRLVGENVFRIEAGGFLAGTIFIVFLSLFLTFSLHVRKPSVLHVLHKPGLPKTAGEFVQRFIIIFLVLNAFFILVFNLLMEWLAIVVDTELVVLTTLAFIVVFIRNHAHKFSATALLHAIGARIEGFYAKFIALFHAEHRFALGFSGLLVLHLLTDVGVFLVPQIFSFRESFYFGETITLSLWSLLREQLVGAGVIDGTSMILLYTLNVLGLLLLMLAPAYIWAKVYRGRGFRVSHADLAVFFAAWTSLLVAPLFRMTALSGELIGIRISTVPLHGDPSLGAVFAVFIGVLVFALSYSHKLKEILLGFAMLVVLVFFTYYIYHYFGSAGSYYVESIASLWSAGYRYFSTYFGLFFIIIALGYIGGWLAFLGETWREYRYLR